MASSLQFRDPDAAFREFPLAANQDELRRITMDFARSHSGVIIAGSPGKEKCFTVSKSTLEKSPVIKGWIEDPESIHPSMVRDGALYLKECDPEVVSAAIDYLEKVEGCKDVDGAVFLLAKRDDALFYAKIYKLALCLAIHTLSLSAIRNLRTRHVTVSSFVSVAAYAESAKLIDEKRFRDWLADYIFQNSETLLSSKALQATVTQGGEKSWRICSALISTIASLREERESGEERRSKEAGAPMEVLTPKARTAGTVGQEPTAEQSPSLKRQRSPYSHKFDRVSNLTKDPCRVQKRGQLPKRRSLNPTVEDCPDLGDGSS